MICFEISKNGEKICTAGIDSEFGVLTSILTWLKRDLNEFPAKSRGDIAQEELSLNVSGHKNHGKNDFENLYWLRDSISIGDEITIKVIESGGYDEPESRKRQDPNFVEKQRQKYFEKLKQEYEK